MFFFSVKNKCFDIGYTSLTAEGAVEAPGQLTDCKKCNDHYNNGNKCFVTYFHRKPRHNRMNVSA